MVDGTEGPVGVVVERGVRRGAFFNRVEESILVGVRDTAERAVRRGVIEARQLVIGVITKGLIEGLHGRRGRSGDPVDGGLTAGHASRDGIVAVVLCDAYVTGVTAGEADVVVANGGLKSSIRIRESFERTRGAAGGVVDLDQPL